MGRLVDDPELKHTRNSSIPVTSFSIAVDKSYQKAGKDREADFIQIVAWRSTAEFACKHFRKGQLIAVQGSIQTRSYTDKDGVKRKAFEIVADNVHFAGSKPAENGTNSPAEQPQEVGGDVNDFQEIPTDDDLPF